MQGEKAFVRKTLAECKISAKRKLALEKLGIEPDENIDLSAQPELTEAFFLNAMRNPFYKPVKTQVTLRLDADVVAWLRQQGKGYQTRANVLLRSATLCYASLGRWGTSESDKLTRRSV